MPLEKPTIDLAEIPSFDVHSKLRALKRIYTRHHRRRFEWMRSKIASLGRQDLSILELGCNDARSLNFVPVRVSRYVGLDAGWRSGWKDGRPYGLDAAREYFRESPRFEFLQSERVEDLRCIRERFDMAIVLETFEYLPPPQLDSYVGILSEKLNGDGCILSTMPNERGLPLLAKVVGSKLSGVRRSEYTFKQFCNALLGRLDRVPRALRGRKGFDYSAMARLIARYFPHIRLEAVEPPQFPVWLSLNVGLMGSKQPLKDASDSKLSGHLRC